MGVKGLAKTWREKGCYKTTLKSSFLLDKLARIPLVLVSFLATYNVAINVWRYDHVAAYTF
ncbi:MAG TPA: hypothetical protein EYH26_04545 [Pyrodictium sp.]|nr:hypothetical protein [Pyrodictium sp.]